MFDGSLWEWHNSVLDVDMLARAPIQAVNDAASDTDGRPFSAVGLANAMHDANTALVAEIAVHGPSLLGRTSPDLQLFSEPFWQRKQAIGWEDG